MRAGIRIARDAGRKVAFTLSDTFCISRHGDDFRALIAEGQVDILFANESELLALAQVEDFDAAVDQVSAQVPVLVVTRGEHGAIAVTDGKRTSVPAQPIARVVDTTGAGDLFAAGFLHGQSHGYDIERSLKLGALCAAEIISHYGARPEVDLTKLMADKLG